MSKNQKKDIWTYVIVGLLILNLFIINNYVTSKSLDIIKNRSDVNVSSVSATDRFKDAITAEYANIIHSVKKTVGYENAASEINVTIKTSKVAKVTPVGKTDAVITNSKKIIKSNKTIPSTGYNDKGDLL